MNTLIGTKIGMTQILDETGATVPVTLVKVGPNTVTQIKTVETDGYSAVQMGYGEGKNLSNAVKGHVKAADITPKNLYEIRGEFENAAIGTSFDVSIFSVGDVVDVTGVSKGKGFAGAIKRHNFHRNKTTHGGNGHTRRLGSIGSMYPQKIFKGKRMPGRMGGEQVTVKNLIAAHVDAELGVIGLRGAVPGPRKGSIRIGGKK